MRAGRSTVEIDDEAVLARRTAAGDHAAFRTIMQANNQRLFRVARSIVRNDADAEEVVQESYLRAFRAIAGFRGEASIATWLTRITINEARGRLRARPDIALSADDVRHDSVDAVVVPFPLRAEVADPERAAEANRWRALIEAAVDDLPEDFRLVFVLRAIDGCSVEETAAHLAVRPETVKTRLHRARRLLRATLATRIESGIESAFPFLGARCQRITDAVLAQFGPGTGGP